MNSLNWVAPTILCIIRKVYAQKEVMTMAVNYERIGKRIQQLRKLKKLSQADLAEFTGMSVSYISHIETGIKHASLESVVRIANALGVTVDQVLNGNQTGNREEYKTELFDLISDCTGYERGIIHDIATAVKRSLRDHSDLLPKDDEMGF